MKFKHLLIALVAVAVTLGFTSCNHENEEDGEATILGKWSLESRYLYDENDPNATEGEWFYGDGSLIYEFLENGEINVINGVQFWGNQYWDFDPENNLFWFSPPVREYDVLKFDGKRLEIRRWRIGIDNNDTIVLFEERYNFNKVK